MSLSPFAIHRGTRAMSRSVLSVVVGYITLVILVIITFAVISSLSPNLLSQGPDSTKLLLLTLIAGWMTAIPGGFVTAFLSKEDELEHALALAGVMIALGFVSMYIEDGAKPLWWHIGMMVGAVPCVLLGAQLRLRTKKRPRALLGRLLGR